MTQIYTRPVISALHLQPSVFERRAAQEDSHSSPPDSERLNDGSDWRLSQPHAAMADHQRGYNTAPPAIVGDVYQVRPATSQKAPREQLPPLSSLFDSPPRQNRHAQSPYSDRNSPVYPTASAHDGRHPAASIHLERPFEMSYFPRSSTSHPYPYLTKSDQLGRRGPPLSPHPSQAGRAPESPRYESRFVLSDTPRSSSTTVNSWSPQSQASHPDYFPRDTSSSFRTHAEHHQQPPSLQRAEPEAAPEYREPHPGAALNYPPTPASTVAGDPTVKDTLGPKIWSGTHFFPRFVRQAEVPGEGLCYFYDDGTHCKTVIDGEVVNAHWGVTKAGKPRKRLAIACITCREKKIKCDPDFPRCIQCEKFGRVCKFKNAPRGSQGSPDTPPAELEDGTPRPTSSQADGETFKLEARDSSLSVSPRQLRRSTPDLEDHHAKRQRTGYNDFTPVTSEPSPRHSPREAHSPSTRWIEPQGTDSCDHPLLKEWQMDPAVCHPGRVSELLSLFFKYAPGSVSSMWPEKIFNTWALSTGHKSLDDLMLIYALIGLGTAFSSKSEHRALGIRYAAISRYACDSRHFSLQLVQSRLILAVYYFTINNPNDAWDFSGAAVRAASGLKLNVESDMPRDPTVAIPYGLNHIGYAECKRRTFWCGYILDQLHGFSSARFSMTHAEDVFLRLPCDERSYETQANVQSPFFDPFSPIREVNRTVGCLAYMIGITSIWKDVTANIYRMSQSRSPVPATSRFVSFYDETTKYLQEWKDSLPQCYTFSLDNMKHASDSGKLGTYLTLHTVYHAAVMKLNRHVPQSGLSNAQLAHHVSVAKQHAEECLVLMDALAAYCASPADVYSINGFSAPCVGFSILSAIDILTERVQLASVSQRLASFAGALSTLADMAVFWQTAKNQEIVVLQRVRDLADLAASGEAGAMALKSASLVKDVGDGYFAMLDPLEKTFPRDYDCIYAQ